jgi:hypothetical protein
MLCREAIMKRCQLVVSLRHRDCQEESWPARSAGYHDGLHRVGEPHGAKAECLLVQQGYQNS